MGKTSIKQVSFKNDKLTEVHFTTSEQPKGFNEVVSEKDKKITDRIRHSDLIRAMEKLAPHILLYGEFFELNDRIGLPIDKEWFDNFSSEDDSRFENLSIKSVKFNGGEDCDTVELIGYKTLANGDEFALPTPKIDLYPGAEEDAYPLLAILKAQIESLYTEVDELLKGKTGATKQMSIFDKAV